jgi:hypothetical protein
MGGVANSEEDKEQEHLALSMPTRKKRVSLSFLK